MPIQHSSNFRNRMIGNTIALLEIAQERLMEVLGGDIQKCVDVLYTSANLFAQEVEELRNDVDSKDAIIAELRRDLDGVSNELTYLRASNRVSDSMIEELRKDLDGMSDELDYWRNRATKAEAKNG